MKLYKSFLCQPNGGIGSSAPANFSFASSSASSASGRFASCSPTPPSKKVSMTTVLGVSLSAITVLDAPGMVDAVNMLEAIEFLLDAVSTLEMMDVRDVVADARLVTAAASAGAAVAFAPPVRPHTAPISC